MKLSTLFIHFGNTYEIFNHNFNRYCECLVDKKMIFKSRFTIMQKLTWRTSLKVYFEIYFHINTHPEKPVIPSLILPPTFLEVSLKLDGDILSKIENGLKEERTNNLQFQLKITENHIKVFTPLFS